MFLALSFMHADANAMSVEVRGGHDRTAIKCSDGWCPDDSVTRVSADIVFSPWKRADLFIGPEYAKSVTSTYRSSASMVPGSSWNHYSIDYSFDYTALSFGVRLKPIVRDRWHFYVALGGLIGTSSYKASFGEQNNLVSLSSDRGSSHFTTLRIGPGAVFNFTEQLGVGIELSLTPKVTAYKLHIRDVNSGTGQVTERELKGPDEMFGVTLGLRYMF